MPYFSYKALNKEGKKISGILNVAHEIDLETRLKVMGVDLVSCRKTRAPRQGLLQEPITLDDLIVLCVQLQQLERAGVPLLDAMGDIRDTSDKPLMKTMMADICEAVRTGSMISVAMAQHPKIFDHVFIGLIAAGEKTGRLTEVLGHLSDHLKWVSLIRRKVKKALYYPIFLLLLMGGVVSIMMLFVVPKLSEFLLSQGFDLPFHTKALIATSSFFQHYGYWIPIIPFLIYGSLQLGCRYSSRFAYHIDRYYLRLPVLGNIIRKIELARFCRFFGVAFKSGIGVLECLDIAASVVGNRALKESILYARSAVSEGESLTLALKQEEHFPSLVLRMFKVGEDSGNMENAMENINFFYDAEVSDGVDRFIGVIQPTLTIVMGMIMLWVSLAVFGPLYSSFSQLNF
jgi:type IV pilus assembly protein PilC